MIRGGPTARNPAIRLAEMEPPAEFAPDERAVWARLAPIVDERARWLAAGGTCIASDAIGFEFLVQTVAWCERTLRGDASRMDAEAGELLAKLATDVLGAFFLVPADCFPN